MDFVDRKLILFKNMRLLPHLPADILVGTLIMGS